MRPITLIIATFLISSTQTWADNFKLNPAIKDGTSVKQLSHTGPGRWDNYLTMNLAFEPMAELFKQLLVKKRMQLANRGEAHITVITPLEFWNVLKPQGVTMAEINSEADKAVIQKSKFDIVCLGMGKAKVDNKTEEAYFVVVQSKDLLNIRQSIQKIFISKGGDPKKFNPETYFPHITLGFTKRDLHESDGVIKGKNSCVADIN